MDGQYTMADLITDRTQADVNYALQLNAAGWAGMTAEQKSDWLAGLKGAYNYTDLNRVTDAVDYIAGEFQSYGYSVSVTPINITHPDGTVSTVWQDSDIPTSQQLDTYLANIQALRDVISLAEGTPELPESMAVLTYVAANNIEQLLIDISTALQNIAASFLYSAQPLLYSGFAIYTATIRKRLYDSILRALNTSDGKALYVR